MRAVIHLISSRTLHTTRVLAAVSHSDTFHTRPLPESLAALSSPTGKLHFREALLDGTMECFFPLSEQFITQSEPSYCSISSLVMVLNALKFDPKKIWRGPWRWVSEETLQCESRDICGHSLDKIVKHGMSFKEFESLANCHGVGIQSVQVGDGVHEDSCRRSLTTFRNIVETTARSSAADQFLVVNFSRKVLKQTGIGHFSPIGGYHRQKDLVLILDVARFKYPPYWVPLTTLWEAMTEKDAVTGQSRGYFVISTDGNRAAELDRDAGSVLSNHRQHHVRNDHIHCHSHDGHNHSHSHSHHGHHGHHQHGHQHDHHHGHNVDNHNNSDHNKLKSQCCRLQQSVEGR